VKAHLQYARYVIRHKWLVFIECCKLGIPVLGLLHDWSKLRPDEWFPYVNFFYGKAAKSRRDETGYYKPTDTGDAAFDFAWLLHQKRNRHHWQWYVLPEDEGGLKVLDMPMRYRKEMLADWRGVGRALGTPNTCAWYDKHYDHMQLHPSVREWIEFVMLYERGERTEDDRA